MSDLLFTLWRRADIADAVLFGDELLDPEDLDRQDAPVPGLDGARVIRELGHASAVECDACDSGHVEPVSIDGTGDDTRAFLWCSIEGRVAVPLGRLRQFEVDFAEVARGIAQSLSLAGSVQPVVPERIWLLGKTTMAGESRELFLGRGLAWPDAPDIVGRARRLLSSRRAVMLVPSEVPPDSTWGGTARPVFTLDAVVGLRDGALVVDRDHIESALDTGEGKQKKRRVKAFATPPGTRWTRDDIAIVMGEFEMRATMRGLTESRQFDEIGFEDRRKKEVPDRLWRLLVRVAQRGGVLRPSDINDKGTRNKLKSYVSDLRERLHAAFSIDGDPIPFKDGAYQCAFDIRPAEGVRFPTPAGARWQHLTICERSDGNLLFSLDVRERSDGWERAGNDAAALPDSTRIAVDTEGVLSRAFGLADLGLAKRDGTPDARGLVLQSVLRGGGLYRAGAQDETVLRLAQALGEVMQIEDRAFHHEPRGPRWRAHFCAASEHRPSDRTT